MIITNPIADSPAAKSFSASGLFVLKEKDAKKKSNLQKKFQF